MGGATGFLWMAIIILALAWALQSTGTLKVGLDLSLWLPVLLVLTLLGAVFNMFIVPFLGRRRTTRTSASGTGTAVPGGLAVVPPAGTPVSGATQHEVVQETRDQPTL